MLQAVIYYIITVILTKELAIATDQHYTELGPPDISCEDIFSKSPETHEHSWYYRIVKRVFCGMSYSGSSYDYVHLQ